MRKHSFAAALSMLTVVSCAISALGSGCDDAGSNTCLPELSLECEPLYHPTFDEIFDRRLGMTCGASSTGGSCHSEAGAMAGLVLADKEAAYDALLGHDDGRRRVKPGNPECSLLMQRLESDDPDFMMPPGSKLSTAERCAIRQWIADGADR